MAKKKSKKGGGGHRQLTVRVKTAKRRKLSSTLWLNRQLNDPYVAMAKQEGYRSRAVYKILEIIDKFSIVRQGYSVVDLGAAPGSWSQIIGEKIGNDGTLVGIDLLEVKPLPNATFIKGDFLDEEIYRQLLELVPKKVDIVMSDMAANTTGHKQTDHLRTMALCEAAYEFASRVLKPGGSFVSKVLRGGTEQELLKQLKTNFKEVKHFKPKSSRSGSTEIYVVALHFKGTSGV